MDMTTGIAAMAQGMSDARISDQLQMTMLKKTNDIQKEQGQAVLQLISTAPAPSSSKGNNINVTA